MDSVAEARRYFGLVGRALGDVDEHQVWRAVELFRGCREKQGRVWVVGNGGSAATASHFANDLLKMGHIDAVALPDHSPVVTAYGNDQGWDQMYKAPLQNTLGPRDVLVAITCSGTSRNVLEACGIVPQDQLIVLTGDGAKWSNEAARFPCYAKFCIPGEIRVVEDVHLAICHCIAGLLREGE